MPVQISKLSGLVSMYQLAMEVVCQQANSLMVTWRERQQMKLHILAHSDHSFWF